MGESLLKQKKFAEALAAYEHVKHPSGRDFEVLVLLHAGQAAAQLALWQKSLELSTRCIEQFPDSPYSSEALCELGWAQQNLGKLDEAAALYEKVLAKSDREIAARAVPDRPDPASAERLRRREKQLLQSQLWL